MISMKRDCNLVPFPKSYSEGVGFCSFKNHILVTGDFKRENINSINELIQSYNFIFEYSADSDEKGSVKTLIVNSEKYEEYDISSEESYLLEITEERTEIIASSQKGLLYGFVTLIQLLMNGNQVDCCKVYDAPEYEWRGFLLDTCRSFYSIAFIKKIIRLCAFHKMNKFHWHLTDDQGWRIHINEYPLLTQIGSVKRANTNPISNIGDYDGVKFERYYYTDEEILEIIDYGKLFNVEIIPEVEFPGHSTSLLAAYPEYGCTKGPYTVETRWGIFDDVLCLGNDKVFDLYKTILSKITKLFPSEYIHIGGDECPTSKWKECHACQKRIKEMNLKNESELQSWGTQKITDLVSTFGKKAIGWDEVLDNTESIPLNDKVIVQSWRGIEGGEKASAQNHKVIMSPVNFCYFDHKVEASTEEPGRLGVITLEESYKFTPVTENMSQKASEYVMGGEATLFTEEVPYSKIAEYMILPRLCSIAECLWLKLEDKNWERFNASIVDHKIKLRNMGFIHS